MAQQKQPALAHQVAQAIRAEQARRNLTNRAAAKELGVSTGTYETWLAEKSAPWERNRIRIARKWKIAPESLGLDPEVYDFVNEGMPASNGQVREGYLLRALALALLDPKITDETKTLIRAALDESALPGEEVARAGLEAAALTSPAPTREVRRLRR